MDPKKQQVILVTGSSGCLGQHVVKLLHENDDQVQEIRCYDIKPFQNNLQHKFTKEMQIITADIRNVEQLKQAMCGVDVVINCAAVIDVGLFPNEKELYSVNVDGTQKMIDFAVECNVPYFIHISGTDSVIGVEPIYYASENTSPIPNKHALHPYSKTKLESEEIVKDSNGRLLANGTGKLLTVILRPNLMYGEEDAHFITNILRIAKCNSGVLRRIDNIFIRKHPVYAGNVAHACLKAKDKMRVDQTVGGEDFFITDDTKILDPFEFCQPYLKCRGFQVSNRSYPYWLFIMLFSLYCWMIKLIWNVYPIRLPPNLTPNTVQYFCTIHFFNRVKSTLRLDYDPLYDHDESQNRSLEYYRKVPI